MKRLLKKILLVLPVIGRFIAKMDTLKQEKIILTDQLDISQKRLEHIEQENGYIKTDLATLYVELSDKDNEINIIKQEIRELKIKRDQINSEFDKLTQEHNICLKFVPPGHFYSPIPALTDIEKFQPEYLSEFLPGIELNSERQLHLLGSFRSFYNEIPFKKKKVDGLRYFFDNPSYSYSDAFFLYSMIRYASPKKIIEVGSGYSSCVTLDTNELFFNNSIDCQFIEPYPNLLMSLIRDDDLINNSILEMKLQDVPIDHFSRLKENDILFIDSTHVSKFNSDVNYLIHKVLPSLNKGVFIHVHDVFYPFEYPKGWLLEGRAWNEQYILRAFLQYNSLFEIVMFNTYIQSKFKDKIIDNFPLLYKNTGGSIWIRKVR